MGKRKGDSSEDRTQLLPSTRRTTPATASTLEVKLAASRTTAFRLKIALAWVLVCLYPLVVAVSWASPRCRATVEERRVQAALDAFRFTDGFDWMRSPAAVYDACPSKARTTITHGVYPMLRELGCGHEVRFPHSHSHKPRVLCEGYAVTFAACAISLTERHVRASMCMTHAHFASTRAHNCHAAHTLAHCCLPPSLEDLSLLLK